MISRLSSPPHSSTRSSASRTDEPSISGKQAEGEDLIHRRDEFADLRFGSAHGIGSPGEAEQAVQRGPHDGGDLLGIDWTNDSFVDCPADGVGQSRILFGTQAHTSPPTFALFTSGQLDPGYVRFIKRRLREEFGFVGTPVHIEVRAREKRSK